VLRDFRERLLALDYTSAGVLRAAEVPSLLSLFAEGSMSEAREKSLQRRVDQSEPTEAGPAEDLTDLICFFCCTAFYR